MSKPDDSGLLSTQLRPAVGVQRRCLDEEEVLAFLDGRLEPSAAQTIEAHVDQCTDCRQLLGFMAKEDTGRRSTPPPEDPESELLGAGQRIDHFEIERLLGKGGMGEIYLAEDLQLRRKIALKVISPGLIDSVEAADRFLVEARATARFNHPHIVTIHSVGSHKGRPYLALELVEGETLKARIDRGPIPLTEALRHARAIAWALEEAHAHQVLHRDLKPQNVMIGKDGRPRVLDFGLAKLFPESGKSTQSLFDTRIDGAKDALRGTPGYMAPEQWKKEPVGAPADIWAFGVIFYELISGSRPYRESSPISYAVKVNEAGPAPPLPNPLGVPDQVTKLIAACLEKSPGARPTATVVKDTLDEMLVDESLKLAGDLERAAERWEASGQPEKTLWDRQKLESAQRVLEDRAFPLAAPAAKFLSASMRLESRRAEEKRRRLTMMVLGLGAGALLLGGLAQQAISRRALAEVERDRAEKSAALALLEGARSALARSEPLEARAKLVSSLEAADSPAGRLFAWQLGEESLLAVNKLGTGLYDLALSPDGKHLAVAAQDHTVYLYDPDLTGAISLRGHADQVMELAFSKDGKTVASASWSGELRLFNLQDRTAKVLSKGPKKTGLVYTEGLLIATTSDGKLELYPLAGGDPQTYPLLGIAADVAVAEGTIYTADRDGQVRRYGTDGQPRGALLDAEVSSAAIALALDGGRVAVGREDGSVALFGDKGEVLRRFTGHAGAVERVRFGPDQAIYSGGVDGLVLRHDSIDGQSRVVGRHAGGVWGLVIGPGPIIYSAGLDGAVKRSRPTDHLQRARHTDAIAAVAYAGETWLSAGYDRRLMRWSDGDAQVIDDGSRGTIYGLATTANAWASASLDQWVRLGRLDRPGEIKALAGHTAGVYAVAFSPDGKRLASASSDRTVRIWDAESGEAVTVLRGHEGPVFALAFTPDGKTLASGGADMNVRLWTIGRDAAPRILRGAEGSIRGLAFAPDGKSLAAIGYDGVLRIHDVKSGAAKVIGRHQGRAYALAYAPDGAHVATAGADGTARVWNLADGNAIVLTGHRGEVNALAYSPDGATLLTAGDDGTLRRYAPLNGRRLDTPALLGKVGPQVHSRLQEGVVAIAERGDRLCISDLHTVEGWDREARRFVTPLEGATSVEVYLDGCLAKVGTTLLQIGKDGAYAEKKTAVEAYAVVGDRLLYGSGEIVGMTDERKTWQVEGNAGATALTLADDTLFLGFANGAIEVGSPGPNRSLGDVGLGKVSVLAVTDGLLVAGRDNGRLDLYDLATGAHVYDTRLHGPITSLDAGHGHIVAGSELGEVWRGPSGLDRPRCTWMKEVWAAHPLAWDSGLVVERTAAKDHPCNAR